MKLKTIPWIPLLLSALMVGYVSYAMAHPSHVKKRSAKIQAVNSFLPFPTYVVSTNAPAITPTSPHN